MIDTDKVYAQLRPYQREGCDFLVTRHKALNFDDMGLGKTITSMTAMLRANKDVSNCRFLVVCPKNALYVWKEELQKWYGLDCCIYSGTPAKRKKIMDAFCTSDTMFLVTTYGMLKDMNNIYWDGIIADEIHVAGLLNHKTATFSLFKKLSKNVKNVFLMTGTPIRQGVIDLYAPLHLIQEDTFGNYWSFVNRYCIVTDTPFGKQIERNPRDIAGFRQILNRYMLRRLKTEVLKDLPGKQRNIIPLLMTPKQAQAHQQVLEELYYADEDSMVLTPNKMTAMLRARQILVSPHLLGIDEDGAALEYIKEAGEALLRAQRPFVVFTPFKQALPIIEDVIKDIELGTKIFQISGGLTPAAFANAWQGFQSDPSKNKVLLCVIKSGAAFHATEASDCFFLGYEWDFNFNVQSEDRLCRLGQHNFVECNYLLHNNTVDEEVKAKLNDKQLAANWIVGTEQQYQYMLSQIKKGRNK